MILLPYQFAISIQDDTKLEDQKLTKFENLSLVDEWGSKGTNLGQFLNPGGIAIDPTSNDVYVVDTGNNRIQKFLSDGNFIEKKILEFANVCTL